MKNKKVRILIFVFICLISLFVYKVYKTPYYPKILEISPAELTPDKQLQENTPISLVGENFTNDMDIYIEGQKLANIEFIDQNHINFLLPNVFFKQGKKEIYVVQKNAKFYNAKSNIIKLNVLEIGDLKVPTISDVTFDKLSDVAGVLNIKGQNFNDTANVLINDILQSNILERSDSSISIKINTPTLPTYQPLNVVVAVNENSIKSTPYSFEIDHVSKKVIKSNIDYLKNGYLVAHAFGGLDEKTYTNSLEAFKQNYEAGHRIFEVDLQFTSDGVLATLHDRKSDSINNVSNEKDKEFKTFEEESSKLPYTILTFEEVCKLMLQYDDFYVVTDAKYNTNFNAIKNTADYMTRVINSIDPKLIDRFIIQFYNQQMYYFLSNNYDFKSYIYTLYTSTDSDEQVIEFIKNEGAGIPVITMPESRATAEFVGELNKLGVYVFAHTVNDIDYINDLLQRGVYGVYTDFAKYDDLPYAREERYVAVTTNKNPEDINRKIFSKYISRFTKSDYMYIICMSDLKDITFTEEQIKSLQTLGLDMLDVENTNGNYLAVIDGNSVIYENRSQDKIEYSRDLEDISFKAVCGDLDKAIFTSIQIEGLECALNKPGINIIVFDKGDKKLVDDVYFDPLNQFLKTKIDSYFNNRRYMIKYLDEINKDNYILAFSVNDDASQMIDSTVMQKLKDLGLNEDLREKFRYSYVAIIDGHNNVFESISENELIQKDMLVDEWIFRIKSAGYNAGAISSIVVDGIEQSMNKRGINIVVFDKTIGRVVDTICFDTFDRFNVYRN